MINQTEQFLNGEGDNWYERNKHAKPNPVVIDAILALPTRPIRYLEVGCGNGRYIGELHRQIGGEAVGIDISKKAIVEARKVFREVKFWIDSARAGLACQHAMGEKFNLIMFGFCLYVHDREDIFPIMHWADAILMDGGYIAIHDFLPAMPVKVPYEHVDGMLSYKMDYASLWLANPAYRGISCTQTNPEEGIKIIQKVGW